MGIFSKIKQMLGIGTVSVKLEVAGQFSANDASIKGKVNVTGKSDQEIVKVEYKLEETYSTGRGDDKTSKNYTLGKMEQAGFSIKAGEVKSIDFELPFKLLKSSNEELAEKGGVMGGLGKLGKMASAEKSTYKIWCTVDVKGASLDPNDFVELRKVN